MFGADVLVMAAMRFFARIDERGPYPVGEIVPGQKSLLVVAPKIPFPGRSRKRLYFIATFNKGGMHWSDLTGRGKMNLTHRETEALDALCDTFVPSLAFERDEDPALFSMSAADLGVSARVAAALEMIEPAKREALRFFLRLLGNPLFMASVSRGTSRFALLTQLQRERVLQRLARSAVGGSP